MNCEMAFLIVFPSFTPKKMHFSQVSNHFSSYSHTPSYLFCSFLIHDGCSFSRTLAGLTIIPFPMSFINQLPIVTAFLCIIHLISYCFPLLTAISSCYYLYHCTRVNRSFHSSGRFFSLQCTSLFTGVERYRYRQENIQMSALYTFNKHW